MTATLPAATDLVDFDRIAAIAARLDLRPPNREALESIAVEIAHHYRIENQPPPFEGVIDVATGVGKTYVLAAALEYLAAEGVRDFAVITPGRTILEKTVANFTRGHPKSLLGGMETQPVVITSDNFISPAMRAAMDDPTQVKLYIFTVQALLHPRSKVGRRTHKFQEGLGTAFYAHLQSIPNLTVFADEHHTYYGQAFSRAVRDLNPWVHLGLTATPHPRTPKDQIIYRYPLAAAIADRLVKTPVLVGRTDDRTDAETKLRDGVRLLELKEQAIQAWCRETGATPIAPVMLVIAPNIDEAENITRIVTDPSFADGRYADRVLTVHSRAPDDALAKLDQLEEPDNPYRIVISVGMLKEGWDVKNVYVIASLRASVSELLTEQTLGRGLRLPFGRYTGVEFLDTLEVLGHERYEDLLRKAHVLQEQFIDYRTRAVLRQTAQGQLERVVERTEVSPPLGQMPSSGTSGTATGQLIQVQSVDTATGRAEQQVEGLSRTLVPRDDRPALRVPRLLMTAAPSSFSLADITDLGPFRQLGERLAADPPDALRRVLLDVKTEVDPVGFRQTRLVTQRAADTVDSPVPVKPLEELREELIKRVLAAPVVPARPNEIRPAGEIVDAFLAGLGPEAPKVLSAFLDRAVEGLLEVLTTQQRRFAAKPRFDQVVELVTFNRTRVGRAETSQDRYGPFRRGVGYQGYAKSLYPEDWFDSSTERDVANLLDDDPAIVQWVRLQQGDLPILWTEGRDYHPDFIAIDREGIHWIIEVKMDRAMASDEVDAKREAARRWANHVSADPKVEATWRYLIVSETDVKRAKGSWAALRRFGGG